MASWKIGRLNSFWEAKLQASWWLTSALVYLFEINNLNNRIVILLIYTTHPHSCTYINACTHAPTHTHTHTHTHPHTHTHTQGNQVSVPLLVSSSDFIWCVYRFQYNPHVILKAIRARVGFGSGTKTIPLYTMWYVHPNSLTCPILPGTFVEISSQHITSRLLDCAL